jgi:uncharacterized protein (PEP-CTERM system associated)
MGITATTTPPSASPADTLSPVRQRPGEAVWVAHIPWSAPIVLAAMIAGLPPANAQTWRVQSSVSAQIEATNRANVDPGAEHQGDLITQITPRLAINELGAHSSITGTVSLPVILYARSSGNNAVRPEVSLIAHREVVPQFFFVDASASVSQQYVSAFGPRPTDLTSATANRNTAQSYRISPYFKGQAANDISYELRDNNDWTIANGIVGSGNHAYTNEVLGHVQQTPRPLGWAADYRRLDTRFVDSGTLVTESERGRLRWSPVPDWQIGAIAGYEDNRYPLASYSGAIYGIEARWRPSDRTNVDASWEHRFFGGSYHVAVQHRLPLSVWSLSASRDITTFPQQLASLQEGVDVNALLNRLFSSRVADPAQRQTLVDEVIRDRGLPSVLSSPLSLFTQQVTLQENFQGTVGLLGARNSVFLTAYRSRSEPLLSAAPSALDVILLSQIDNTQTGTTAVWTHNLTQLYVLSTSVDWVRTVANDASDRHSSQVGAQSVISAALSPLTHAFAGLRYLRFSSSVSAGYDQAAVFVGVTHVFR